MAIYMKVPGINGQAATGDYKDWIVLDAFNFNVSRSLNMTTGTKVDREQTNTSVSELCVNKTVDQASPKLFSAACGKGSVYGEVDIHVVQTNGDTVKPYLQYKLNNVLFSNYQIQGEKNCDNNRPQESVSLNYDKIEMTFIPYDDKHQAGGKIVSGYDVGGGKAL